MPYQVHSIACLAASMQVLSRDLSNPLFTYTISITMEKHSYPVTAVSYSMSPGLVQRVASVNSFPISRSYRRLVLVLNGFHSLSFLNSTFRSEQACLNQHVHDLKVDIKRETIQEPF